MIDEENEIKEKEEYSRDRPEKRTNATNIHLPLLKHNGNGWSFFGYLYEFIILWLVATSCTDYDQVRH